MSRNQILSDKQILKNASIVKEQKNSCRNCNTKLSPQKVFCNKQCKETFFEKIKIQIPEAFIKRIYQHFTSEEDKNDEISKFANTHNFEYKLVKERVEEELILFEKKIRGFNEC